MSGISEIMHCGILINIPYLYFALTAAPRVTSGLSGLRVLKTTQSAFVDFHRCDYTTLPNAQDRILSTVVKANWSYDNVYGLNFDAAW